MDGDRQWWDICFFLCLHQHGFCTEFSPVFFFTCPHFLLNREQKSIPFSTKCNTRNELRRGLSSRAWKTPSSTRGDHTCLLDYCPHPMLLVTVIASDSPLSCCSFPLHVEPVRHFFAESLKDTTKENAVDTAKLLNEAQTPLISRKVVADLLYSSKTTTTTFEELYWIIFYSLLVALVTTGIHLFPFNQGSNLPGRRLFHKGYSSHLKRNLCSHISYLFRLRHSASVSALRNTPTKQLTTKILQWQHDENFPGVVCGLCQTMCLLWTLRQFFLK